jgi:cytochrome P450
MLRLESPGRAIPRMTTREVDIGGVTIPAQSAVWLALEAAGRANAGDEISTAGTGEIQRRRHWAFGGGTHRCLGLHLARLEMAAFLTEWLSRIPNFDVAPDFSPTVVCKPTSVTHLDSLMLRWSDDSPP